MSIFRRLSGDVPSDRLDARQAATAYIFEILFEADAVRVEISRRQSHPWLIAEPWATGIMCSWLAISLQRLASSLVQAGKVANGSDAFLAPATAAQAEALFVLAEKVFVPARTGLSGAKNAQNPDLPYRLPVQAACEVNDIDIKAVLALFDGIRDAIAEALGDVMSLNYTMPREYKQLVGKLSDDLASLEAEAETVRQAAASRPPGQAWQQLWQIVDRYYWYGQQAIIPRLVHQSWRPKQPLSLGPAKIESVKYDPDRPVVRPEPPAPPAAPRPPSHVRQYDPSAPVAPASTPSPPPARPVTSRQYDPAAPVSPASPLPPRPHRRKQRRDYDPSAPAEEGEPPPSQDAERKPKRRYDPSAPIEW